MGWNNISFIAARSQINLLGEYMTLIFDDGTEKNTKGIVTIKDDVLKKNYAEFDGYSLIVALFKAHVPDHKKLINIYLQEVMYSIINYKMDPDGFYYFYLSE